MSVWWKVSTAYTTLRMGGFKTKGCDNRWRGGTAGRPRNRRLLPVEGNERSWTRHWFLVMGCRSPGAGRSVGGSFMHCYECLQVGVTRDAIGLCHHCSAALCTEHAFVVADPVTTIYPLMKTVVLPKRARLL